MFISNTNYKNMNVNRRSLWSTGTEGILGTFGSSPSELMVSVDPPKATAPSFALFLLYVIIMFWQYFVIVDNMLVHFDDIWYIVTLKTMQQILPLVGPSHQIIPTQIQTTANTYSRYIETCTSLMEILYLVSLNKSCEIYVRSSTSFEITTWRKNGLYE